MERDTPGMKLAGARGWGTMRLRWDIGGVTVSMMNLRREGGSCRIEVEEEKGMFSGRKWIDRGVQGGDEGDGRGEVRVGRK